MWLINAKTLKLEYFVGKSPRYAILSHRWGPTETSFQEWQSGNLDQSKSGVKKLLDACRVALEEGIANEGQVYLWYVPRLLLPIHASLGLSLSLTLRRADTACIDKTSSAELSEAINSMFEYYRRSAVCFAYLDDVSLGPHRDLNASDFIASQWFTRGWTLQELLAPRNLKFYDVRWQELGRRADLSHLVTSATGIPRPYIEGLALIHSASISERMSWVSNRITTRLEDIAYCMLGIFNINMPLLYGEGPKAFIRLQEELLRSSDDGTIFAWDYLHDELLVRAPVSADLPRFRLKYLEDLEPAWEFQNRPSMLAPDPVCYCFTGQFRPKTFLLSESELPTPPSVVNFGLSICLKLMPIGAPPLPAQAIRRRKFAMAFLDIETTNGLTACFVLENTRAKTYTRVPETGSLLLMDVSKQDLAKFTRNAEDSSVFVSRTHETQPYLSLPWKCGIGFWPAGDAVDLIHNISVPDGWMGTLNGFFGDRDRRGGISSILLSPNPAKTTSDNDATLVVRRNYRGEVITCSFIKQRTAGLAGQATGLSSGYLESLGSIFKADSATTKRGDLADLLQVRLDYRVRKASQPEIDIWLIVHA